MKRLLVISLVAAVIVGSCIAVFTGSPLQVSADDPVITFPDPGLDAAIRTTINKSTGDIYQSDLDGLTYLDAQVMNISDLTGLEHCSNLSTLYLSNNQINNISTLSSLYSLQELSLNNNQIGNISMLSGLINLHQLFIDSTNISDISPLSGLTNLQWLCAEENQIADISSLSGLTNLQKLYLGSNQVSNLSVLSSLTNLQWLYLGDNGLTNISSLPVITDLQFLDLGNNQISNISALSDFTSLQGLYLGNNQLSDIIMISSLSNLQDLSLGNNQIDNISALSGLNSLQTLNINDNQISDVNALSGLSNMQYLDFQDNQIGNISALSGLTDLQTLLLSDNNISDISALSGFASLQTLFLNNNDINNISSLSGLVSIHGLELRANQIVDIQPLVNNSGLDSGDYVVLGANPLSAASINTYIPALKDRGVIVYYTVLSEVWVDDDYVPGACGGHTWGYDAFNKIQDGIDAVSGSTVHVAEGTYYENIVLKDGVELLGADMNSTIIDGMQNGSVVTAINCGNTTKLEGFTVTNGSAFDGGGMYNNNASPVITNCTFQNNMTAEYGGGMYNTNYSSPNITGCTFWNNLANIGGGMLNENQSSPAIVNCTFWNNSASVGAGGILNGISCTTIITNCTFWNNSAQIDGGIANFDSCPIITNCILWNDSPNEITNYCATSPVITYCNIESGYSGTGNIDLPPMFVNSGTGDFHLSTGSPCIDTGNNSAVSIPDVDFEGDPRIWPGGGKVDMGIDERVSSSPVVFEIWVDDDYNAGSCGGHTWGYDAFNEIQCGIYNVSAPGTIHVAAGTYYENIMLRSGVQIFGEDINSTIIDGCSNGSTVMAIYVDATAKIDGFTITNGSGTLDPDDQRLAGGGMYNSHSSPTVSNCIFEGNSPADGGGIFNIYSSPTIMSCYFLNNTAAEDGGGICNLEESSPTIIDCIFECNTAHKDGGGIFNAPASSSPTIVNCVFWNNEATGLSPTQFDDGKGGGIYNWAASPIIANCNFIDNSALDGGAIRNYLDAAPVLTNCVIWENSNPQISGYIESIFYSDIQGGYTGEGNINSDPLFVNSSAGDFHLSAGSPCINAGSNSAPSLPALDYEGDPRILPVWGTVDMGVDEYIHPAPTCDSWYVQYRIVGGQITMNYSVAGMTPVKKITNLSEEHGGYMTFKFCKEANNGGRLVVIPQDSWYMENITVENVMTGIDMNLSIRLDSDASGILYVDDSIGDVDVSSESVSGRTPVQIDTIGDGTVDATGSMLIPMTLVGDFDTSVGQSGELPFGMIFTTGNTTNVAHIPINTKMDGATMTSEGVPFAEEGGVASYAGTNGTITATGTGDCLGIRLVGIRIDFQFEMKLELEPVRTADVNCDGSINVLDMIRIGQHWGQTGSESWLPEDVNSDGTINVLDMIVIGQNWTG